MMASRVCECISYTICNTNVLSKVYVSATTFVQYKFKKKSIGHTTRAKSDSKLKTNFDVVILQILITQVVVVLVVLTVKTSKMKAEKCSCESKLKTIPAISDGKLITVFAISAKKWKNR